MEIARVDYIFQLSDKNRDGCLDKDEFAELVRSVNPDVALNGAQLELIQEEVWSSFPSFIDQQGLTLDGLKQIYLEGIADLDQDYSTLLAAHSAAAAANEDSLSPVAGVLGMAALAAATPAPISPGSDIFDAVKTPAPSADADNTLAFAVRLPGVFSEAELDSTAAKRQLLAALKAALPEGTVTRVAGVSATPLGLAVGVVCRLPQEAAGGEEEAYFSAVLKAEPEQVFPAVEFGQVEVLSADPKASMGAAAAAVAAAEALAAATLANAPGKASLALSVRLPTVDATAFKDSIGAEFMAQLQAAMPAGTAARAVSVAPASGGCLVTVAAAVPAAAMQQARQLVSKLRHEPKAVFDGKTFKDAALVAAHLGSERSGGGSRGSSDGGVGSSSFAASSRPTVGIRVRLPGQCAADLDAPGDVAAALERALPEGCSVAVRCIEDSPRGGAALVTLAAALPAGSDGTAIAAAAAGCRDASRWVPQSALQAGDGPAECTAVGSGLEAGFGGLAADIAALHFGLTRVPAAAAAARDARSPSVVSRLFPSADDNVCSPPLAMPANNNASFSAAGGGGGMAAVGADGTIMAEFDTQIAVRDIAQRIKDPLLVPAAGDKDSSKPSIKVVAYTVPPGGDNTGSGAMSPDGSFSTGGKARAGGWLARLKGRSPAKPPPPPGAARAGNNAHGASAATPDKVAAALQRQTTRQRRERGDSAEAAAVALGGGSGAGDGLGGFNGAASLERAPRALTPYEVQQRINAKEWAVMDAHIGQICAQLQFSLDAAAAAGRTPHPWEVSSTQDAASLLPPWARHAAHMDIGEKLAAHTQYAAAARSFREAAAAWPEDPLARFRLGNVHFAQQEYLDASRSYFDALQRCEQDDPLLVKVHINMGISLESEGRMEAAEREYSKAASLAPNHPRAHKLVGSAKLALGDAVGAVEALTQATTINPNFADAWADLGCAHVATGDLKTARSCLNRALFIDPDHIEAHFNSGNMARQGNDLAAALRQYDRVLELDPEHWRAWLNRGVVMARLPGATTGVGRGVSREAAGCLARAVELSGHGGALEEEVEVLHRMIGSGAGMVALAQQVGVIEERARRATLRAMRAGNSGTASMVTGTRTASGGAASASFTAPHGAGSIISPHSGTSTPVSKARSVASVHSGGKLSRSTSQHSLGLSPLPRGASDARLAGWIPAAIVAPADFGPEVRSRLEAASLTPETVTAKIDIPLLQALQPLSCLALETVWAEAMAAEDTLTELYIVGPGPQRSLSRSLSRSASVSARAQRIDSVGFKSKMMPAGMAESMLVSLVRAHALPHLARPAMDALAQVLALLDAQQTGAVDVALVLCVLCALVDAPTRERLDMTYRLLMWRTREKPGAKGDPVTRKHLIDLLATLKSVFECEHKTDFLAGRQFSRARAADSQFVLYERFASEVLRMFTAYDVLPLLTNPL